MLETLNYFPLTFGVADAVRPYSSVIMLITHRYLTATTNAALISFETRKAFLT
jgi:hypothetical protein